MAQNVAILDRLLTQAASGYVPPSYLAEMILPEINVKETTGKLGKYGTSHLRIENTVTGGRGAYRRVQAMTRTTTDYKIDGHGLEGVVTKDDYRNVQLPFKAEEDEALGLSTMLWLEKEKLLADTLVDTAVISQSVTLAGPDQYSDLDNSDPLDDFKTARATVKAGCGVPPNLGIMSWEVWNLLQNHPQLLDSLGFKYDRPGGLNEAELAKCMGVKKLIIGEAMYESANEGQTSALAPVWGKHIIFAVAPEKAAVMQVSLGYMVRYEGGQPRKVYKYPIPNPPGTNAILVEDEYDMLISNAAAAYSIKSAIA
jgi:hypothetical protein